MRTLEQALEAHGPLPLYLPDGAQAYLNELQIEDINKLAALGRALGDLPVGYGKTAIATCVALMLQPAATVILVPPILLPQWGAWLGAIRDNGRIVVYEGTPKERRAMRLRDTRWVVMSNGIFRNDFDRVAGELAGAMLIVDEAQAVKSHTSKTFKAVREFSEGHPLLLMSGTIMSKPGDGYAYVKLNNPSVYPRYINFTNLHVAKWDYFEQPEEWQNLDILQDNLNLSRVKRTAEEVHARLPKINWIPIEYKLAPEHMALYRQLMDEQLLEIGEGKIDATTAGKLYSASQQIIANWAYFADDETVRPALFDVIDEMVDEIGLGQPVCPGDPPRSKLIIWTIFKRTSKRVLEYLNSLAPKDKKTGKQAWRAVGAYGDVDSKAGVKAFLEDPAVLGLVAQPGSAGVGLNPQHLCWETLFAEFPTTTIPFEQAYGRIWRTGQVHNPNIRLALAQGTVQMSLRADLFGNDKLVTEASGRRQNIKDLIYPE